MDAELELLGPHGGRLDAVKSYTALRSIAAQNDRFALNGRLIRRGSSCWIRAIGPSRG